MPYIIGFAVVTYEDRELNIESFDALIYTRSAYREGDILLYCPTLSICVASRVVEFTRMETVNGVKTLVSLGKHDTLLEPSHVRGKVVLVLPREIWIPLSILATSSVLISIARRWFLGYSYAILILVSTSTLFSVYALIPPLPSIEGVELPSLRLSGVLFDSEDCSIVIMYTGELEISTAIVSVNETQAEKIIAESKLIRVHPNLNVLTEAFESGRHLSVAVMAEFNSIGRLTGSYRILVGGEDLRAWSQAGSLLIENPNCFPVNARVMYALRTENGWEWVSESVAIQGRGVATLNPPSGTVYAMITWLNQGRERSIGVPLR